MGVIQRHKRQDHLAFLQMRRQFHRWPVIVGDWAILGIERRCDPLEELVVRVLARQVAHVHLVPVKVLGVFDQVRRRDASPWLQILPRVPLPRLSSSAIGASWGKLRRAMRPGLLLPAQKRRGRRGRGSALAERLPDTNIPGGPSRLGKLGRRGRLRRQRWRTSSADRGSN